MKGFDYYHPILYVCRENSFDDATGLKTSKFDEIFEVYKNDIDTTLISIWKDDEEITHNAGRKRLYAGQNTFHGLLLC